ncbi:gliding motility protein GldL [Bacteroidales bacterium OttesenSCG-928-C19]|nr:gliding motility protein GldL [Bacteroidales bacterium OttesenSCG-928-C19]
MSFFSNLVRSKGYKNFMAKLYGLGAAVVILGALFKIMHWPGAGVVLSAGMLTECIIFIFSAFEPLHVEYDWSLVYPELAGMESEESLRPKERGVQGGGFIVSGGTATQQLDQMLTEAKIGPELIQSLGEGLQNLADTTSSLKNVSMAAVSTEKFAQSMTEASSAANELTSAYRKTANSLGQDMSLSEEYLASVQDATNAIGNLANIYKETAKTLSTGELSYVEELKKMATSLSSINALYDLQLQNSTSQLEVTKQVQERIQGMVVNFADSAEGVLKYKEQVDALSKKVAELNSVYGNMLAAMQARA